MKYEELINDLRHYSNVSITAAVGGLVSDAAAAIEALDSLLDQNTQRCEALRKQLRESHESYERHLNELEAQLPKLGEWTEENRRPKSAQFVCSICHRTAYDPQPSRDPKWVKRCRYAYCPNCGAKMKRMEAET